ncbi:hypothetical protein L2E82_04888 [Cichorium intybus]|uniref:Uncharacterized protein n=1 Tax=Cichorium intybus TaxID=13427 RepID=A0ACB9H679_CICIN|nr:hypothetical protein L2E82_04888 [Cichorium intybus]
MTLHLKTSPGSSVADPNQYGGNGDRILIITLEDGIEGLDDSSDELVHKVFKWNWNDITSENNNNKKNHLQIIETWDVIAEIKFMMMI